jgi:DNA-binding NarL/FixJ family response regulator
MQTITPNHSSEQGRYIAKNIVKVCVVDGRSDDYLEWQSAAATGLVDLHFAATAAEALRLVASAAFDLWVVNSDLPDIGGHELCAMLKAHRPNARILVTADEYSTEAERRAWAARASMFACKPLAAEWLPAARPVSAESPR